MLVMIATRTPHAPNGLSRPAPTPAAALAIGCAIALNVAFCSGSALAGPPAASASALPAPPVQRVAVFGTDDRVPPPAAFDGAVQGIGLLFDPRSRSVCTAFCVADAVVATAAHCLYRPSAKTVPRPSDFWFGRSFDRTRDLSRIEGYANASAPASIVAGTERVSTEPPITATGDWALVRLAKPVCKGRNLLLMETTREDVAKAAAEGRFFQLSYHRDFQQWRVAYSGRCALVVPTADEADGFFSEFARPEQLLLHQCDTGGASSGSPLLVDVGGSYRVVGINIGTYVQSRSLLQNGEVVRRLEPETVANTGILVSAFAGRVGPLAAAGLASSRQDLRRLQARLAARGHYAGPVDGVFRESLRAAIERYEAAEGLPVTGIAGKELLRRMPATR